MTTTGSCFAGNISSNPHMQVVRPAPQGDTTRVRRSDNSAPEVEHFLFTFRQSPARLSGSFLHPAEKRHEERYADINQQSVNHGNRNHLLTRILGNGRQQQIGRSHPCRRNRGKTPEQLADYRAPSKAVISRKILASKAIVPSSVASCMPRLGSLSWVISTEESE